MGSGVAQVRKLCMVVKHRSKEKCLNIDKQSKLLISLSKGATDNALRGTLSCSVFQRECMFDQLIPDLLGSLVGTFYE